MTKDIEALDGNAAAGRLRQLFAFDMTKSIVRCAGCSHEAPLAELRLYGGDTGIVLRCRRCDAVNLRVLEAEREINFDFSGAARITAALPEVSWSALASDPVARTGSTCRP